MDTWNRRGLVQIWGGNRGAPGVSEVARALAIPLELFYLRYQFSIRVN